MQPLDEIYEFVCFNKIFLTLSKENFFFFFFENCTNSHRRLLFALKSPWYSKCMMKLNFLFVFRRYCVSIIVALTQAMKYAIAWQLAESICLLVGLGAYPVSSNPIPGMGPSIPIQNG